ncbi:hypothetical protein GSI_09551 [Ganoderma sinense ZZ0214-1]|uniref:BTB domain-containing protein n=1 Tax=Ganoderma sinense ZZ0214-1 TaxID=1077348 RepID=A0A2G8S3P7_9APHY|nr:hypothetical protein GSI_09551 [Ganoderma sinense ZZ0214-1]
MSASPPVSISSVSMGTLPGPSSTSGRSSLTVFESEQIPPPKFWFDDIGIHVALVTTDRIAYRVRRDCLESVSRRLQHLIAKASKVVDKESPFGCSTVSLDIPSSRLKPFLEVVTDSMESEKITWLAYRRNAPNAEDCLSFSWLASLARTAHELGAYHVRFAALTRIRRFFEFDAPSQLVKHSKSFQANWEWWARECGLTVDVEDAIEALNLSLLLLVPFRSPLALYACCLLPPAQLRSGVTREDGVAERLSDEDFERCMRALPLLHLANHDNLVKTFDVAGDWECLGAHHDQCEGKYGMRKIREAYMAHMKMLGPYRPDLRDLLSSLKFKSLPYERLSASKGSVRTPLCQECMKRLVDRSEGLCCEEADNLEKYFFPEEEGEEEEVEADDVDYSAVPSELEARTPRPSRSESPIGTDTEVANGPNCLRVSSGRSSSTPWTTSGPESEASSRSQRSGSPTFVDDSDDDDNSNNDVDSDNDDDYNDANDDSDGSDDGEADELRPPIGEGSKTGFSPRLEIEMPLPLAAMLGWDEHDPDLNDSLRSLLGSWEL